MLSSLPMPAGDLGTWLTLTMMRSMVNREFLFPIIRLTASQIVSGSGRDGIVQAQEIRGWLDGNVDFLRDPDGVEMLHGPVWQVKQILSQGRLQVDCDDVAMLSAALGKAVGLRARFVVVAFDNPNAPYRHVWTELSPYTVSAWTDMDITRPMQGLPFDRISRVSKMSV